MPQLKMLFKLAADAESPVDSAGLRVTDLARQLSVTPATASSVLDRLVERGLVERRDDPQDRRQHRCLLTGDGEQLVASLADSARIQTAALLSVLAEDELQIVQQGIRVLLNAAERLTVVGALRN